MIDPDALHAYVADLRVRAKEEYLSVDACVDLQMFADEIEAQFLGEAVREVAYQETVRLNAELARLRATLALFADQRNWRVGIQLTTWEGRRAEAPWTIAQEVLVPPAADQKETLK